jgi:predicted permease
MTVLKARLLRGRVFTEADDANHPRVTVLNESMAKKYFPGEDALGKMIGDGGLSPNSMRKVVGIIEDVREGAADDPSWPAEYFSIYNSPDPYFEVAVRTSQDENAVLPGLVKTLRSINPNLGVYGESTMTAQLSSSQSALLHRFASWLVGGFAGLALVLGVVGLYGVVAYSVSQRTREIGVRMALGATRSGVINLVLRGALSQIVAGLCLGIPAALLAGHLMGSMLYGVSGYDPLAFIGATLLLGVSAAIAGFIPAHRAASIDPMHALRSE